MQTLTTQTVRNPLASRLQYLSQATGHENLYRLSEGLSPAGMDELLSDRERHDATSSCLMDCFAKTGHVECFALLFELNQMAFLRTIRGKLRGWPIGVDAQDVLQQVFLRIHSYPHRFVCEKPESFRNWAQSILHNTLSTVLKRESRAATVAPFEGEFDGCVDPRSLSPAQLSSRAELATLANIAYLVYLNLYLDQYRRLQPIERRVLDMVEIEGMPYARITTETGIPHMKSVVHRLRQKVHKGVEHSLRVMSLAS